MNEENLNKNCEILEMKRRKTKTIRMNKEQRKIRRRKTEAKTSKHKKRRGEKL